jgi:hypothetical protein
VKSGAGEVGRGQVNEGLIAHTTSRWGTEYGTYVKFDEEERRRRVRQLSLPRSCIPYVVAYVTFDGLITTREK